MQGYSAKHLFPLLHRVLALFFQLLYHISAYVANLTDACFLIQVQCAFADHLIK